MRCTSVRYTPMKYKPNKMYTYEMRPGEIHANEMHGRQNSIASSMTSSEYRRVAVSLEAATSHFTRSPPFTYHRAVLSVRIIVCMSFDV
jgi:hypothetical protein